MDYDNIEIPPEIVATHGGRFHTDEVFAIAILKKLYPKIIVWRTRDEDDYTQANLRVDIGRKNNPKTGDFDHHQKEGAGQRENGIPYASAGLVWKHFGPKIVDNEYVLNKVDTILIQPIDALDNGVEIYEKKDPILPFSVIILLLVSIQNGMMKKVVMMQHLCKQLTWLH